MPAAAAPNSSLELLTFLTDSNSQVRQVALSNLVGFSSKQSSTNRNLLIDIHKDSKGKQILGRDGKPMDTIRDLKDLCKDQPITAHDAFSCLINLTDSLLVAKRVGDGDFLQFLVSYIADPVSLLTDLACMLLSNLTKLESISSLLLSLKVKARPFHTFMSSKNAQLLMDGMDADPDSPDYEDQKRLARLQEAKIIQEAKKQEELVPAMTRLLDAFEEGATSENQQFDTKGGLEEMRKRALESQKRKLEKDDGELEKDGNGRPKIKRKSNCNFLASVFANVTVIPAGRQWFVSPLSTSSAAVSASAQALALKDSVDQQEQQNGNGNENGDSKADSIAPPANEYPVARIMPFTEHPDLIRRGGVVSCLKNILFIKSAHPLLIAPPTPREGEDPMLCGALRATSRPTSSIDLLPYLLLPLCDGKELSEVDLEDQETLPEECQFMDEEKKREKDPALRLMLIECLLLLVTGIYGRQCLRSRGAYIVVREAHLRENDEKITEAVVRLVNILKRDESADSLREENEETAAAIAAEVGAEKQEIEEEENDDDLIIEEL